MRQTTEPFETYDEQTDYDWDYDAEERAPRPRIMWGRLITLVGFMLVAYLIGVWVGDDGIGQGDLDAAEAQVTRLQTANDTLEGVNDTQAETITRLRGRLGDPSDTTTDDTTTDDTTTDDTTAGDETATADDPQVHIVQEGDTLQAIVTEKLGCTTAENSAGEPLNVYGAVVAHNEDQSEDIDFQPNKLAEGQEIFLPPIPPGYTCP